MYRSKRLRRILRSSAPLIKEGDSSQTSKAGHSSSPDTSYSNYTPTTEELGVKRTEPVIAVEDIDGNIFYVSLKSLCEESMALLTYHPDGAPVFLDKLPRTSPMLIKRKHIKRILG